MLRAFVVLTALVALGCGARSGLGLDEPDASRPTDAGRDAAMDAGVDAGVDAGPDAGTDAPFDAGCMPVDDGCSPRGELCGDGDDDDCDGAVDEGCGCEPGEVQACFSGPPGRRDVGACQDGTQVCTGAGRWAPCAGGVVPDEAACTGRDDLCNGCSEDRVCMIDCPSPGDPRVPEAQPFDEYALRGGDFYVGAVASWGWRVEGGPCDGLAPRLESFELRDRNAQNAVLVPKLSGDYRVTLSVHTPAGDVLECSWVVHVRGPGLRVEMCYPESETQDLDLFLHRPNDTRRWYPTGANAHEPLPEASCGWHNCEAIIRQPFHPVTGAPTVRVDWGYGNSDLSACVNGPQGGQWIDRGSCANPRLDIDNNLSEGIGLPENINVNQPRDGQTFRIMVQNFTGTRARPVVNVYCAGSRVATYGLAPDEVPGFEGMSGNFDVGAMWRVADVTVHVDAAGETTGCDVAAVHPPGRDRGYDVTQGDARY